MKGTCEAGWRQAGGRLEAGWRRPAGRLEAGGSIKKRLFYVVSRVLNITGVIDGRTC